MSAAVTALRSGVRWPARAAAFVAVLVVCAAVAGFGFGRSVNRAGVAVARPDSDGVRLSTVVSAAGVSDCHPLVDRPRLTLGEYTFWGAAALPVVIDRSLHVWGPSCVVSAGLTVADGWISGSSGWPADLPEWSPPPWDESHAGPSSSTLLDLPGVSDCAVGFQPTVPERSSSVDPFVVVVDRDGQIWGPRCVVSSGIAAS